MLSEIKNQSQKVIKELISKAYLQKGDTLVIGCSSSEVCGDKLGTNSNYEVAQVIFDAMYPILKEKGIYLASQCCEHLNRCVVIERELAILKNYEVVSAVPKPKAGGSFATISYINFENPVLVEKVSADAGIDIGLVLIGMQLKNVAVPIRLSLQKIGDATIVCANTRPKFIGGIRAEYE